jgi:hypothetical protein
VKIILTGASVLNKENSGAGLYFSRPGGRMSLTETVARWILDTSYPEIPEKTKRATAVASFDAMGCMLAGSAQPSGKLMSGYIDELGGSPHATVVGTGQRTSAANAALANGTFGHALDYDDRGMLSHAASLLLAALMAVGEKVNASGKQILEATIIGREVGHALSEGCATSAFIRWRCLAASERLSLARNFSVSIFSRFRWRSESLGPWPPE